MTAEAVESEAATPPANLDGRETSGAESLAGALSRARGHVGSAGELALQSGGVIGSSAPAVEFGTLLDGQ